MTRNKCNLETEYKMTTGDKIGVACGIILGIMLFYYILIWDGKL